MNRMPRLLLLLAVVEMLLSTGLGADALSDHAAPQPASVVLNTEFGLVTGTKESFVISSASEVPLMEGQRYGWRLKLCPGNSETVVREQYEMPVAPAVWGSHVLDYSLSEKGRVCTSLYPLPAGQESFHNIWTITKGDPPGEHVIRLFVGEEQVASFRFVVK